MTNFINESHTSIIRLPVQIRVAQENDLTKLEWYGQFSYLRNLFRGSFREMQRGQRIMLVAICNEFPVGRLFIQYYSANLKMADGHNRAYLYSFRVMEFLQQQGIGSRLLTTAEQILRGQKFRYATIAAATNNTKALNMYIRRGYQIFSEEEHRYYSFDHERNPHNVREPCYLLEKDLLFEYL